MTIRRDFALYGLALGAGAALALGAPPALGPALYDTLIAPFGRLLYLGWLCG